MAVKSVSEHHHLLNLCGEFGNAYHSFIHSLCIEHLLCARHYAKGWEYSGFHAHTRPHRALVSVGEADGIQEANTIIADWDMSYEDNEQFTVTGCQQVVT